MKLIDPARQALEEWRPGVMTRMLISARTGAGALCVFEQFCDPGTGAPMHTHTVEEVLTVLSGSAEIWLGEQRHAASAGHTVIIPPGVLHGFRNTGAGTLHMQAILAAAVFEAVFEGSSEIRRRWAND
jgi:quercetin dioxygenase-like cupin family protein